MLGKTQRGVSERPNKPKMKLVPKWLGNLVLVLVVLCILVALGLWKPWQPVAAKSQVDPQNKEQPTNKGYEFYELLPKQQVTPIPDTAVPESKPADQSVVIVEAPQPATTNNTATDAAATAKIEASPAKPAASFILQAGSFQDHDSADARRAAIILNGLSANVVKSQVKGQVWFRVISGPYESQNAAVIAQQSLQNSSIDSIVVKQ